MPKYVFCDLDYTLLNNNKSISKENLEAIKEFETKGNHFIICSGRVPFSLKKFSDQLGSKNIITSNGAVIISNEKIIKYHLLSEDIMIPVTKYCIEHNINARYFTMDHLIVLNQEASSKESYLYPGYKEVDKTSVFESLKNEKIIKIVFSSDDKQLLKKAEAAFKDMNLNMEVTFSSDIFLEVNALNQNKGNGILDFCKYNNIDINDTIAIGDNDNDIPMIKVAGYSACPSNSIDRVKKLVDYVSVNDCNHNAIKEILEKIS